jgi:hypothetical protein
VARVLMGLGGAALISVGALISVYGYLSANLLSVPRGTFALAERGDFPAVLGTIHARFRTPYVSIVAVALAVWAFALLGSFAWNVTLSAVARLFYYAAVCAAVPVLRRRQPQAAQALQRRLHPAHGHLHRAGDGGTARARCIDLPHAPDARRLQQVAHRAGCDPDGHGELAVGARARDNGAGGRT